MENSRRKTEEQPFRRKDTGHDAFHDAFGAVILAAGYSSRMKAFKPLLQVGDVSAVERLVMSLADAGIRRIVAVTGHERDKLAPVLERLRCSETNGPVVTEAYNARYDEGMFSSIKTGLTEGRKAFDDVKGFFLMPADCPLISASVIRRLMEHILKGEEAVSGGGTADLGARFHVPVFEGKKGHPLYIPREYIAEICGYEGPGGLKAITDRYGNRMARVPVEEEGCVLDMDTPEGYEEIKAFLAAGCRRKPLAELAAGRRIFLVRHGETKQHAEKMFIGRYDVPLKDDAEENIKKMARRLAAESPDVSVIYTSPLKRARQTAEIVSDVLLGRTENDESRRRVKTPADRDLHLCIEEHRKSRELRLCTEEHRKSRELRLCIIEDFQEISLGEWDGKPISWVKEHFPEEYAGRGRDMFAFKVGNRAENFYDVQYRTVKAMGKILENDASRDVIIVTHSAVIRALENNLKGLRVGDDWNKTEKNDYVVINL